MIDWKDPRKHKPEVLEDKYGVDLIVVQYDPGYNENPRNPLAVNTMFYHIDKGFLELDHNQEWCKPADPVILWDYKPYPSQEVLDKLGPINIEAYGVDFE